MTIINKKFGKDKYTATYEVDEAFDNSRLDQFLQSYMPSHSREAIKRKIKDGEISIQDRPGKHKSSTKLHHRERVTIVIHKTVHEDEYWRNELIELQTTPEIVFEDDDLIVISKPSFMSTHPTGKHLFNCATVYFENIHDKTIHSIHRLDRETSGILLLGKNPKAANKLTEEFENNNVKKCYFFIAKKNDIYHDKDIFECDHRLGASESGLKRVYIDNYPKDSSEGKSAHTKFKIVHKENDYVIGLAFPKTGRQHQIRVHALVNGLPLVGDKLYLGSFKMFQRFKDNLATKEEYDLMEIPRHALHAISIKIPYKSKDAIFKTKIPLDLKSWLKEKVSIKIQDLESLLDLEIKSYFKTDSK